MAPIVPPAIDPGHGRRALASERFQLVAERNFPGTSGPGRRDGKAATIHDRDRAPALDHLSYRQFVSLTGNLSRPVDPITRP